MKILIISGFLGSGKTTFINKLMKIHKDNYVVMENEYASVNVDADLLENNREKIWEMTEGCICCSLNKDIGESVLTISNTLNPEYLIIEPTGIGKLSQIVSSIKKVCYERIELLNTITLVDATSFLENIRKEDPYYLNQISFANIILLTKTENLQKEEATGMLQKLNKLNSNANCILESSISETDDFWQNILKTKFIDFEKNIEPNQTLPDFEQIAFKDIKEDYIERFLLKLNLLLRGTFGEILRIKGFLPINKQWTKVNSTGKTYELETIDEKETSKLVIIGRNLKKEYISDLFLKDKLP